jgi:hypothetical protein
MEERVELVAYLGDIVYDEDPCLCHAANIRGQAAAHIGPRQE